ncbi:MAG TPA: rhomboid family intramembrane serine protease [Anaeromyxobacteraceae bacterium]|nr:rhomboid family intramembrane serine protease [Anaeromyxobacteraceae bacterium]
MIPLPLRDDAPRLRFPAVTVTLIAANGLAWLFELQHGVALATLDYGLIPSWLVQGIREGPIVVPRLGPAVLHQEVPYPWTVLTSMFMHGGWLHIIGNMWFLWIFGDNVEDAMGRVRFAVFYLLCGLAAAMAQVLVTPSSAAPMVGASGAIAGVLGAYLLLYPRARVRCLWVLIVFVTFVNIPAWTLLGLWFLSQFFVPLESGVAWMAHVGGFVAGLGLVRLFAPRSPRDELRWIRR